MSMTTSMSTLQLEGGSFPQHQDGATGTLHRVQIRRWDGAARSSSAWDGLKRDPELWHRAGNCYVHLYGRGQSRRGPAFRIPFSLLLSAQCHPLIERFVAWDGSRSLTRKSSDRQHGAWNPRNPAGKVELYIPPPPGADKEQAFRYHLATRNFFAWVCRRSLVGETLGDALVGVLNSMHEFRDEGQDNVAGLIDYMEEEGYLDMREQPDHALGVLFLAEAFRLKGMYINAFAHCVGMNGRLYFTAEYRRTSNISKKLIRQAKVELDLRLRDASARLTTLLEEELSDAHLGLAPGSRAHMERFRSFLLTFYTSKLGCYPPKPVSETTGIFDKRVYDMMRDDFECLHELMVDETFTSAENSPFLAHGGICAVQSVHSFDLRCRYKSLEHPLPLLPELPAVPTSRRISWFTKNNKLRPDERLLAQAALLKASNNWKSNIMKNDLVQAYREFEEDSVPHPSRVDKKEKLSLIDGRKVRWIMIYALYQVLRSATEPPPGVRDIEGISYSVAISTVGLPPWKEGDIPKRLSRRQTPLVSTPLIPESPTTPDAQSGRFPEIRPDIDYFALTQKSTPAEPVLSVTHSRPSTASRTKSLTRNFGRTNDVIRRSLSLFRASTPGPTRSSTPANAKYHEILVQAYGNGTNSVKVESRTESTPLAHDENDPHPVATRTPSNSSTSSRTFDSRSQESTATSATSPQTSPTVESKASPWQNAPNIVAPIPIRARRREVVSLLPAPPGRPQSVGTLKRPASAVFSSSVPLKRPESSYALGYALLVEQQREEMEREDLEPVPLRIQKGRATPSLHFNNPDAWGSLETAEEKPEWKQYPGLGGHTPLVPTTT